MNNNSDDKILKNSFSRRNFLKTGSLAVGTLAAGLLAGCGDDIDIYRTIESSDVPQEWDKSADVVIVGFGGAAAMAAIHAVQGGATVQILEAQTHGGGSTAISGGGTYMGSGTDPQVNNGFTETVEEFYTNVITTVGEGGDPDIVRAYAENSRGVFDALVATGVTYEGFSDGYSTEPPEGKSLIYDNERRPEIIEATGVATPVPHLHFPNPPEGTSRAGFLWQKLEAYTLAQSNLNVSYSTEVKKLIVNNDGRVVGVLAEKGGVSLYYKAKKAVILCTGGFIKNDEMVKQFIPYAINCFRGGNAMDIGTGIKMAQAIGADTKLMNAAEDYCPTFMSAPALVKAIQVNPSGVRFAPEDYGGTEMGKWIVLRYPLSYIIFDQTIMDEIPEASKAYMEIVQANTLGELAALINVSASYLTDTLTRYNAWADAGFDEQFRKNPVTLQRIETAPFYAQVRRISNVFTLSCGGLRINPQAQVLKPDGEAIPGLYAAGATTAHVNAQYYVGGGGTGGAFHFGRIAGLEVINEAAWDEAANQTA